MEKYLIDVLRVFGVSLLPVSSRLKYSSAAWKKQAGDADIREYDDVLQASVWWISLYPDRTQHQGIPWLTQARAGVVYRPAPSSPYQLNWTELSSWAIPRNRMLRENTNACKQQIKWKYIRLTCNQQVGKYYYVGSLAHTTASSKQRVGLECQHKTREFQPVYSRMGNCSWLDVFLHASYTFDWASISFNSYYFHQTVSQ